MWSSSEEVSHNSAAANMTQANKHPALWGGHTGRMDPCPVNLKASDGSHRASI